MSLKTHLTLGRVSNLPTVWTNVLTAGTLAGATLISTSNLLLLFAMSLFYVAGMYYNDACDAEHDTEHQPYRPIPAGLITQHTVEAFAFAYGLAAFLLVYSARMSSPEAQGSASIGWLSGTLSLVLCIVVYNRHHKDNSFSPILMAACRAAVIVTSSYALTASFASALFIVLLAILAWLTGLTFLAKHEHTIEHSSGSLLSHWPLMLLCIPVLLGGFFSLSSPAVLLPLGLLVIVIARAKTRLHQGPVHLKGQAIGLLIAGICLVDGLFLAWVWGIEGAIVSVMAMSTTLLLQRWVAGT
ncbi:MAG: UbiA family prenyltransferase [Granulosicoccus sp.]